MGKFKGIFGPGLLQTSLKRAMVHRSTLLSLWMVGQNWAKLHHHLLTTPPTLRKAGQSSINNSDSFSEDEGVGPGTTGPAQSIFKLDS